LVRHVNAENAGRISEAVAYNTQGMIR